MMSGRWESKESVEEGSMKAQSTEDDLNIIYGDKNYPSDSYAIFKEISNSNKRIKITCKDSLTHFELVDTDGIL